MKKILALSLVLSVLAGTSAFAAEQTTYTEKFIQKHTEKIVDKEKQLQQQQKAREDARLKQQKERQKKLEQQKREREKARAEQQKKIEKKKQLLHQLINE